MIIIHGVNDLPLPRLEAASVVTAPRTFPVVVLTGARQMGKSTLARELGKGEGRAYRTLDDPDVLERAREEPAALLRAAERLTLDEVQRSPDLACKGSRRKRPEQSTVGLRLGESPYGRSDSPEGFAEKTHPRIPHPAQG